MKKKILTSMLLAASLLISSSTVSANAENETYNKPTDSATVTVTATVESEFIVSIPKTMELVQKEKGVWTCDYEIDVDAVISSSQYVSVIPDSEVILQQDGKDDVVLTVDQKFTIFRPAEYTGELADGETLVDASDITPETTGLIKVADGYELTAGYWEGYLNFEIELANQ